MNAHLLEILKLNSAERLNALEEIWESLSNSKTNVDELTTAQKKELQNRMNGAREGKMKFFSWEEIENELKTSLK